MAIVPLIRPPSKSAEPNGKRAGGVSESGRPLAAHKLFDHVLRTLGTEVTQASIVDSPFSTTSPRSNTPSNPVKSEPRRSIPSVSTPSKSGTRVKLEASPSQNVDVAQAINVSIESLTPQVATSIQVQNHVPVHSLESQIGRRNSGNSDEKSFPICSPLPATYQSTATTALENTAPVRSSATQIRKSITGNLDDQSIPGRIPQSASREFVSELVAGYGDRLARRIVAPMYTSRPRLHESATNSQEISSDLSSDQKTLITGESSQTLDRTKAIGNSKPEITAQTRDFVDARIRNVSYRTNESSWHGKNLPQTNADISHLIAAKSAHVRERSTGTPSATMTPGALATPSEFVPKSGQWSSQGAMPVTLLRTAQTKDLSESQADSTPRIGHQLSSGLELSAKKRPRSAVGMPEQRPHPLTRGENDRQIHGQSVQSQREIQRPMLHTNVIAESGQSADRLNSRPSENLTTIQSANSQQRIKRESDPLSVPDSGRHVTVGGHRLPDKGPESASNPEARTHTTISQAANPRLVPAQPSDTIAGEQTLRRERKHVQSESARDNTPTNSHRPDLLLAATKSENRIDGPIKKLSNARVEFEADSGLTRNVKSHDLNLRVAKFEGVITSLRPSTITKSPTRVVDHRVWKSDAVPVAVQATETRRLSPRSDALQSTTANENSQEVFRKSELPTSATIESWKSRKSGQIADETRGDHSPILSKSSKVFSPVVKDPVVSPRPELISQSGDGQARLHNTVTNQKSDSKARLSTDKSPFDSVSIQPASKAVASHNRNSGARILDATAANPLQSPLHYEVTQETHDTPSIQAKVTPNSDKLVDSPIATQSNRIFAKIDEAIAVGKNAQLDSSHKEVGNTSAGRGLVPPVTERIDLNRAKRSKLQEPLDNHRLPSRQVSDAASPSWARANRPLRTEQTTTSAWQKLVAPWNHFTASSRPSLAGPKQFTSPSSRIHSLESAGQKDTLPSESNSAKPSTSTTQVRQWPAPVVADSPGSLSAKSPWDVGNQYSPAELFKSPMTTILRHTSPEVSPRSDTALPSVASVASEKSRSDVAVPNPGTQKREYAAGLPGKDGKLLIPGIATAGEHTKVGLHGSGVTPHDRASDELRKMPVPNIDPTISSNNPKMFSDVVHRPEPSPHSTSAQPTSEQIEVKSTKDTGSQSTASIHSTVHAESIFEAKSCDAVTVASPMTSSVLEEKFRELQIWIEKALDRIHTGMVDSNQVRVQWADKEFGHLQVNVTKNDNSVTVEIVTSSRESVRMLESEKAAIERMISNQSLRCDRLDIRSESAQLSRQQTTFAQDQHRRGDSAFRTHPSHQASSNSLRHTSDSVGASRSTIERGYGFSQQWIA